MKLTELANIIKIVNEKAIKNELKGLGYINCEKHKQYKYISIVDLKVIHKKLKNTLIAKANELIKVEYLLL